MQVKENIVIIKALYIKFFGNYIFIGGSEGGCYWAGTSPLCNAKCAKDFFVKKHSASGDGAGCLFGNKKFCCPNSQQE